MFDRKQTLIAKLATLRSLPANENTENAIKTLELALAA